MNRVAETKTAAAVTRYTRPESSSAFIKLDCVRNDGVYRISFKGLGGNQAHKLTIKHPEIIETITTLKESEPKPRVVIIDLGNIAAIRADFIGSLVDLKRHKINIYLLNPSDIAREVLSIRTAPGSFNIRSDEATVLSEIGPE